LLFDKWRSIRRKALLPAFLGVAAVTALVWGIYQNQLRASYESQLRNMYTRSFYELVDSMDNVQTELSKLMVSNSNGGNVRLLSDISRQADDAVERIAQLPLTHPALSNTMGLVTLTSDYCRSLYGKAADGHPLTNDDIEHLKTLYNNCVDVTNALRRMQTDGKVSFTDLNNKTYYDIAKGDEISTQFSERDKSGVEYPTLIYDGPFSESVVNAQAKGLPPGTVDEAGAKQAAAAFLKLPDASGIAITGACKGRIETYLMEATDTAGNKVLMQVTKQGGKVLQMIEESGAAVPSISAADCAKKAVDWLAAQGFGQMNATFMQQYDGLLVVNFAPVQDNAVLYTDLVKVKVRMDNGTIAGFDATGYWMNHVTRPKLTAVLTQQDAQKLVSTQLNVTGTQLALIPMSGDGERLCWEFKGTFGGDTFYVYIDAVTGEEADVFKVINTANGSLVV
jgi:spore germination protein